MNCKKGDLAICVGGRHAGKVVTCVRFVGQILRGTVNDYWEIDRKLSNTHRKVYSDSALRPIRDQKGEDETLQWAPVPSKEIA